ncbi:simple sugar transport system substrate-binding protein [Brachybacterium muris]|uniref:autoinducer 2 ABC transporter substrate-binding protein n=1 Tax=Brachybacterium muris TaxID=219301 RepID=UPI001956F35D|nr:autoinducer 2 ABC transporter substrate-binding protein [Brachybacterium muris]MBM7502443.1 simple sugar transport system substrate-binding protein [Brachybacterium muris]MCT1429408.1 autoinducer 2 ABC transporter substrate-binding protein [Brachybacterium muris]
MSHTTASRPPRRTVLFSGLGILAVGGALAACGTTESGTPAGEGAEGGAGDGDAQGAMVTVPKLTGIAWFNRMEEGVKEYAEATGENAYYQGSSEADAAAQVRVLEDLIASNVAALCVTPFQPDAVEQTLKKAMDAGIKVITHEAPGIQNADFDIEAFKNADYGINLMDELAKAMGEKGEYALMVGSLSSTTHMEWVDAAKKHQEENYPEMTQVGDIVETSDDSQKAYEAMQELLSAHPDLAGVQGSASTDVVGVGQAVEEAGLQDRIAVVGTSTPADTADLLESGAIDVIQFWDPGYAAYAQNVVAKLLLDGETVEAGADLGIEGYSNISIEDKVIYGDKAWINVTKDNAGDYDY